VSVVRLDMPSICTSSSVFTLPAAIAQSNTKHHTTVSEKRSRGSNGHAGTAANEPSTGLVFRTLASCTSDGVDLVDEDRRRRVVPGHVKQNPNLHSRETRATDRSDTADEVAAGAANVQSSRSRHATWTSASTRSR
jgi:hypothetical protein